MHSNSWLLWFGLAVSAASASSVTPGASAGVYAFRGALVTPDGVLSGTMVVEDGAISCIGPKCSPPAGATEIHIDDGYIFPGFIDAHQHMSSNISPVWKNSHTYGDRYQWQKDPDHLAFMAPQQKYVATEAGWCDAERYAEIRQLVSGVTTIQGTGRTRPCVEGLIRNADSISELPVPAARVMQHIPDVRLFNLNIDWTVTRSLAIHLGEGVDDYAREELDVLEQKGLLRPETLVIHGTAFGAAEFERMAKAGAKLVWSPQSNIALYGKSMNVEAAIKAGVEVSLGVDWSPSGSHDVLAELKVADQVNRDEMHNVVKPGDWVAMITTRPARGLSLEEYVGSLTIGKKADFTVLRKRAGDPNASLLQNRLADVEMVWVGGRLLYGDESLVEPIRSGCETVTIEMSSKRLCVADPASDSPPGKETFAELAARIRASYAQLIPLSEN